MEDIDQFGFEGIQCDTCGLIIRPGGTYDYSEMEKAREAGNYDGQGTYLYTGQNRFQQ